MLRGMFEDRIQNVIREIKERPNLILFVDEAHTMVGAGSALGAPSDAANVFKSVLARGEVRMIGATTLSEYKEYIQEDEALARRFRTVHVAEPSVEETRRILYNLRPRLERHHNVVITESALRAAIELTDRHQTDRMRPDRAIDALDEACAHTHAVAAYSDRAQELIRKRRAIVTGKPARKTAERPQPAPEPIEDPMDRVNLEDDPIERMARDGFAALAQFGAEIEEIFQPKNGVRETATAAANGAPSAPKTETEKAPVSRVRPEPVTLASVDAELNRVLAEEGVVVRGHDIARVVRLATSKEVTWTE
jgi:ATP-dependent Clp protease ATP-binding subunit ClpA